MLGPKTHIVSRKFIRPSNPTPEQHQTFKLSVFDHLAPSSYIKILLYFSTQAADNLVQLEESLSHTLSKFYPLAGRLMKDEEHLFIDCSDQGVEYFEAKADGELPELLLQELEIDSLDQLLPQLGPPDSATTPLVAIQTNLFDCGGLAIGVCVSHKVADTCTVVAFINGWAKANKEDIDKVLRPSFGLSSLFPLKNSIIQNVPDLPVDMDVNIVTRRFLFDESKIAILKDMFNEHFSGYQEIQPTRVTLVTAVIWNALISVSQGKHGQLRPSLLSPAMNLRGRTSAVPISQNAFGNSWIPFVVRFTPQGNRLDLFDLVPLLSSAMINTAKVINKANSDEISLIAAEAFAEVHEEILRNNGVDVFICSSWSKFAAYEADFSWGKPFWVSSARRHCEMFTLLDTKYGDGIEAWVCLNDKDMNEFECDPHISTFSYLC